MKKCLQLSSWLPCYQACACRTKEMTRPLWARRELGMSLAGWFSTVWPVYPISYGWSQHQGLHLYMKTPLQRLVPGQPGEQDHHSAHFTNEKVKPEKGQLSSSAGGTTPGLWDLSQNCLSLVVRPWAGLSVTQFSHVGSIDGDSATWGHGIPLPSAESHSPIASAGVGSRPGVPPGPGPGAATPPASFSAVQNALWLNNSPFSDSPFLLLQGSVLCLEAAAPIPQPFSASSGQMDLCTKVAIALSVRGGSARGELYEILVFTIVIRTLSVTNNRNPVPLTWGRKGSLSVLSSQDWFQACGLQGHKGCCQNLVSLQLCSSVFCFPVLLFVLF